MILDFINIANIVVVFQLLVFSLFLFTKRRNTLSNKLLGVFLFAEAIVIFNFIVARIPGSALIGSAYLNAFSQPFRFLWGPTFYLYVLSLISPESSLSKRAYLHSIPFLTFGLFLVFQSIVPDSPLQFPTDRSWLLFPTHWRLFMMVGVNLHITAYCILALRALGIHRDTIKRSYSSLKLQNLFWLSFIVYGYCLAHCISMTSQIVNLTTGVGGGGFDIAVNATFFTFFNIIFFNAWTRPGIFSGNPTIEKYKASPLTPAEVREYSNRLMAYMREKKPYLKPELSLDELAEELAIAPRFVSQVINQHLQQNFFDFINSFRVEEAKRMLSERTPRPRTVLEVLYDSGFNTKSAFYVAFKKCTGLAPKQYRKHAIDGEGEHTGDRSN